MTEIAAAVPQPAPLSFPPAPLPAPRLRDWLREGWRAGFLLPPRAAGWQPRPLQLLAIVLLAACVEVALGRLEVPGPASFAAQNWLAPWSQVAAAALLVWVLLAGVPAGGAPVRPTGLATWMALWLVAAIPPGMVSVAVTALHAREALPPALAASEWFAWALYLGLWAWTLGIAVRLGWHFGLDRRRLGVLAAGLLAIFAISAWQFPGRPWEAEAAAPEPRPRLALTQEAFEQQQAVWRQALDGLAPQRPGVRDVYALVFAPFAAEDVFLRESAMVAEVLASRFDAQGRVLQLVNHPSTNDRLPWATPLNLRRAVEAMAQRMDLAEDVLVLYLTSHGARNHQLAAAHWPLQVEEIGPSELRRVLDDAGVRHRVIAISACYSGGWIAPLAGESTLVMTAADADSTSYGCGTQSELTFFGRALVDEQLRKSRSFEHAFAAAVPVIARREQEAGKPDGFSNPQISVGERIRPVLKDLEQRLAAH